MLYFAYGSMMDLAEMLKRCPSAQFVEMARLPDHSLQFTRRSTKRCCGVADAVPQLGKNVWGVVYKITEIDLRSLDRAEGFQSGRPLAANSYIREQRQVYRDGAEGDATVVWIYFAHPEPNPPLPSAAYKGLLVDGAKNWHLPEDYQAELARIPVSDHGELA